MKNFWLDISIFLGVGLIYVLLIGVLAGILHATADKSTKEVPSQYFCEPAQLVTEQTNQNLTSPTTLLVCWKEKE